jgi:hypothetical protein
LAREANISLDEAKKRIKENVQEYKQVRDMMMDEPTEVVEVEDAL